MRESVNVRACSVGSLVIDQRRFLWRVRHATVRKEDCCQGMLFVCHTPRSGGAWGSERETGNEDIGEPTPIPLPVAM